MFILLLAFIDPGSAILILRDGKPIQTKVEGAAGIQTVRKITAKTNFRLASITKRFTASAILPLPMDGKLAVNDAVGKYIPAWPPFANAVTVRHLLTHSSGLPDYDNEVPGTAPQLNDADVLAFVQKAADPALRPRRKVQLFQY